MNQNFKAKVNNSSEFNISEKDIAALDSIKISNSKFHVLQNNNSYEAEMVSSNFHKKEYQITINNNNYSIKIQDHLDALIKSMGFEVGASKVVNNIKAPMPGLILDINVKVGEEIKEDAPLLVLEAMKMENTLVSPRDGVIKSIAVSKGEAVDKNQLLIEFE
ncbi:acetyl-CoA carboxylase biotin carboxyl carrier protein subunit [Lacinutrix mariniflava]|uniref:acetyl-CoA carboxylase biotin carboxyl carrier protein subunit n=1 Tax=Lacinutrix mariniflava TaxID=342955 RepID=UPI0006E45871|nr:acetyl-CoA carboxylase biotin carboxyl carrier protein subunit [Lacinutrix mariniflava]